MKEFILTRSDGKTARLEADRFSQDGAGTQFFDADGAVIASFGDGQIKSVAPAGLTFGDEA